MKLIIMATLFFISNFVFDYSAIVEICSTLHTLKNNRKKLISLKSHVLSNERDNGLLK